MPDATAVADSTRIDFRPGPQVTNAIVGEGEIRFELQLPPGKDGSELEDVYFFMFEKGLPNPPHREAPITARGDATDSSKVVVTYRPPRDRSLEVDRRAMIGVLAEMDVPITGPLVDGMRQAFEALGRQRELGPAGSAGNRQGGPHGGRSR